MIVPWSPIVVIDIVGSIITLGLAISCFTIAHNWAGRKPDNVFRNYIFLLTLSIVLFAISRSFGHLVKQVLLYNNQAGVWKIISPYSGALNSAAFVVIFAFGFYFQRVKWVHLQFERYKNNLEEMIAERTTDLEDANTALAQEIREHASAEQALKESQGYLQAILDHTTLPIFLKAIDGSYILVNREYSRVVGTSCEDAVGQKDMDFWPDDIIALFHSQDQLVIETGDAQEFEETLDIGGRQQTFLISKFPLYDNDVLYAIGGVCTDITRQKQVECKLADEQEQLAVTLRCIGDGVITTDIQGRIVLLNKVAEELTGWQQSGAIGKQFKEVFRLLTNERKPCQGIVSTALWSGEIYSLDEQVILVSKDGHEMYICYSGAPIRDRESRVVGTVIVFRDVSHQRKLEEESLKAMKLESVGILAGGIAHDFNNILAAILGNLSLAQIADDIGETTREMLSEAEKATLRARDLTQQLLTFSKGGEPVRQTSSLEEIVRDTAAFVLHGDNVAIEFEFADDLYLVEIDKGQISQVVQNIIINAKQAMSSGGTIQVRCENIQAGPEMGVSLSTPMVAISIADHGAGISKKIIDKIFDPYFSTKSHGNGLGLAICHSIIRKHKGQISVQSTHGEGTEFTILLPAAVSAQVSKVNEPQTRYTAVKAKILVMDDEEIVREVLQAMLVQAGHKVTLAANGEDALGAYTEAHKAGEDFDLIIMDLTIPGGMGGEEAVKGILQIKPDAKVVVSSGYSTNPIMANYADYGFCGAIVKPYQYKELVSIISSILS